MEIRRADAATRPITGRLVPYDEVSLLTPHRKGERIQRGAFASDVQVKSGSLPMFVEHGHSRHEPPVGRSMWLRQQSDGLYGAFRISRTVGGDEALTRAVDGSAVGLSIGFTASVTNIDPEGCVVVVSGRLHECSLVGVAAYMGANIVGDVPILLSWSARVGSSRTATPRSRSVWRRSCARLRSSTSPRSSSAIDTELNTLKSVASELLRA